MIFCIYIRIFARIDFIFLPCLVKRENINRPKDNAPLKRIGVAHSAFRGSNLHEHAFLRHFL